jgi:uncharacterized protein (TIGR02646 family)
VRKIEKREEPDTLTAYKRKNPNGHYDKLNEDVRRDIRTACTREQYYLCAYCCQTISGENTDTMNEHVEAQSRAKKRTLDFGNIVASCTTPRQCDAAHGAQVLELTPLMEECETEMRFKLSGRVEGMTRRAVEAIRVLNLGDAEVNNKALIEKRKQLVDALIWRNYRAPAADLLIEDDCELVDILMTDLRTPVDGRLEGFAPVLVNILQAHLDLLVDCRADVEQE